MDQSDWWRIAKGEGQIPVGFQRFIAAWELVMEWSRQDYPDIRDRDLQEKMFIGFQPTDDWNHAVSMMQSLGPVEVMSGNQPTGQLREVRDPSDARQVFDVVYTVRCNLLKGGKGSASDDDIKKACAAADVVIAWYEAQG